MGLSWRRTTRKSGRSTIHVPSFFIRLPLTASECRRLHRASAGGSPVSLLWLRSSSTRRSHLARLLGALVRMFIDKSRLSSPSRTPSSLMNPGGTRLRFWKDQTILVMRGALGSDGSRLGTASQSAFSFARSSSRARARSSASVASFWFSSFTSSSSSSSGSSELATDRSSSEVDAPSHAAAMSFASRCSASSRALNASANLALCHLFLNFDEGAGAPASCLSPPSPSDSLAALLRPWLSARRSAGAVWIDSRTPCPGMAPRRVASGGSAPSTRNGKNVSFVRRVPDCWNPETHARGSHDWAPSARASGEGEREDGARGDPAPAARRPLRGWLPRARFFPVARASAGCAIRRFGARLGTAALRVALRRRCGRRCRGRGPGRDPPRARDARRRDVFGCIDVGAAGRGLGGCGVAGRAPTAGVAHRGSRGGVLAAERQGPGRANRRLERRRRGRRRPSRAAVHGGQPRPPTLAPRPATWTTNRTRRRAATTRTNPRDRRLSSRGSRPFRARPTSRSPPRASPRRSSRPRPSRWTRGRPGAPRSARWESTFEPRGCSRRGIRSSP